MNIGSFPPGKFLPDTVKPVISRYAELRSDADDAESDLLALRNRLDAAREADISEAADNLSAGIKTKPTTKHFDQAVRAVNDAQAQHQAYQAAVPKVALEVKNAFRDATDEIYSLADAEFTEATGEFMQCIEALASARARWLISVEARRFAVDATTGRRNIFYHAPSIEDKLAELRKEAGTDAKILFAPRPTHHAVDSGAYIVKLAFDVFNVPSHALGNTLTVVAEHPDYDKAIERLSERSHWYLDSDCVLLNDSSVERVDIVKVKELPAHMNLEWISTAANRHHAPSRVRTFTEAI